jgi:hypothetical protein
VDRQSCALLIFQIITTHTKAAIPQAQTDCNIAYIVYYNDEHQCLLAASVTRMRDELLAQNTLDIAERYLGRGLFFMHY